MTPTSAPTCWSCSRIRGRARRGSSPTASRASARAFRTPPKSSCSTSTSPRCAARKSAASFAPRPPTAPFASSSVPTCRRRSAARWNCSRSGQTSISPSRSPNSSSCRTSCGWPSKADKPRLRPRNRKSTWKRPVKSVRIRRPGTGRRPLSRASRRRPTPRDSSAPPFPATRFSTSSAAAPPAPSIGPARRRSTASWPSRSS